MADCLSADRATRVKTDTPMLKSFMNSENLHINSPKGQDSIVYRMDVNGTQKRMTVRSPRAIDIIYLRSSKARLFVASIKVYLK